MRFRSRTMNRLIHHRRLYCIIGKAILFFVALQPLLFTTLWNNLTHCEYSEIEVGKEYFDICRDQFFVKEKKKKEKRRKDKNFDRSIIFLFFRNEKALRFFYRDKLLYFKIGFFFVSNLSSEANVIVTIESKLWRVCILAIERASSRHRR